MRIRHLVIGVALVAVVAAGGGWWWLSQAGDAEPGGAFEATGIVEARQVGLAPEIGGRVVEVLVEEGDRVAAGQPLVRLDDSLLLNQRAQAEAALRAAQANLALLESGATEEQLRAAESQLAQAEANMRLAQAALDALTAGTRPEDLAVARASLDRARARYDALTASLTPDQLDAVRSALNAAETNLAQAKARRDDLAKDSHNPAAVLTAADEAIEDAQAALDALLGLDAAVDGVSSSYSGQIQLGRESWEIALANLAQADARHRGLEADERATGNGLDAATSSHEDAQSLADLTREAYESLIGGTSAPALDAAWAEVQRAQAQLASLALPGSASVPVESLLAQVDAAVALRDAASANLDSLRTGALAEQIEAAQAQADAAQSQLDALDLQIQKLTLTAPWDGVVLTRSVEPGQTALPGGTLLEIGRLDRIEITAYLPEERFGRVTLGQPVSVRVDAYPERTFTGTAQRLADEAEFTPTNVQTKEDRTRLVYAVVIGVDNPDLSLKPGMIADVVFDE